ncbi:MAG: hypothetical protein RLZZ292_1486 [Bacteroidota bacterium]|jgi:signal transduction histidine kinase
MTAAMAQQTAFSIQQVRINDNVTTINNNALTLVPNDDEIEIDITTLPAQRTLYYELKGFDTKKNQTHCPTIRYTNLNGGNYTLYIYENDTDTAKAFIQLPITVKYSLFEETWFRPSFVLYLLLLVLGVAYLWNLYDQRRTNQLAKMKNKLVSELHNDTLSSLSSISVFASLLKKQARLTDDDKEITNDIIETAQETTENLRDIMGVIDPMQDTFFAMLEKMRSHALKVFRANEIAVTYTTLPNDTWLASFKNRKINVQLYRNSLLIFKESIQNIVKHAQATEITIEQQYINDCIQLTIRDNGKGFDTNQTYTGFGMRTLQGHAKESFIELTIDSEIGQGTTVLLGVPVI